jgi:nucleotide-binding universal stress UspA family protein
MDWKFRAWFDPGGGSVNGVGSLANSACGDQRFMGAYSPYCRSQPGGVAFKSSGTSSINLRRFIGDYDFSMTEQDFSLLLCTNGDEHNRPALQYGVWLASLLDKPVTILGISEVSGDNAALDHLVADTVSELQDSGIAYQVKVLPGRGPAAIAKFARSSNYLTILGRLGRSYWLRFIRGRSFRRVLELLDAPILYVPKACIPIKRILVCLGGLGYARDMENICLEIGRAAQAEICLLHVVEPVTLEYPVAHEVHEHWKDIIQTNTVVGGNLRNGIDIAQATGLNVTFKVRQGNIFHQIIAEARAGGYDLIGMGSAYSAHALRHLYLPNITAEVAESLERPVLTARRLG